MSHIPDRMLLLDAVRGLLARDASPERSADADWRHVGLRFAEAALRLAEVADVRAPHVAVLGPTQTGKSTVVNLLLGRAAADVSPLAGFTVHAAGFIAAELGRGSPEQAEYAAPDPALVFPGWVQAPYAELSPDRLHEYALERAAAGPQVIVWDTPDFDSIRSRSYVDAVLEAAALANVHVVVVSKEKYADRAVWKMLTLLAPLGRATLFCLNKVPAEAEAEVAAAMRRKISGHGGFTDAPLLTIRYAGGADAAGVLAAARAELQSAVTDLLPGPDVAMRERGVAALLAANWRGWTADVRAEHAAADEWQAAVWAAGQDVLRAYQRDYLEDPARFDAFRLATIELLTLLEIPGVAPALRGVRRVITWPARRLWTAIKGAARRTDGPARSAPESVLLDALETQLTRLERDALRRADPADAAGRRWQLLARRLAEQRGVLLERLQQAAAAFEAENARAIQSAAAELYTTLQKRPALLNSLRAARATADAAAIALAIKTGGAPVHDVLFAPALLAVTSLLTEGALGSYTGSVEQSLKQRQLDALRGGLIEQAWTTELHGILSQVGRTGCDGLTPEQLALADAALHRWTAAHGLAIAGAAADA